MPNVNLVEETQKPVSEPPVVTHKKPKNRKYILLGNTGNSDPKYIKGNKKRVKKPFQSVELDVSVKKSTIPGVIDQRPTEHKYQGLIRDAYMWGVYFDAYSSEIKKRMVNFYDFLNDTNSSFLENGTIRKDTENHKHYVLTNTGVFKINDGKSWQVVHNSLTNCLNKISLKLNDPPDCKEDRFYLSDILKDERLLNYLRALGNNMEMSGEKLIEKVEMIFQAERGNILITLPHEPIENCIYLGKIKHKKDKNLDFIIGLGNSDLQGIAYAVGLEK